MPVPPQESAPSLSPRQSFGCQCPLPWVTGTDRTGILWAPRQLQGFLPGVLFSLCALPHLEESRTGQQASRSPALRSHIIHGKTQTILPTKVQLSQDNLTGWFRSRLHVQASSIFPNHQGFFHSILTQGIRVQGMRSLDCKEQTQTLCSGQVFHGFSQAKHSSRLQR
jgi:hypothetical protein